MSKYLGSMFLVTAFVLMPAAVLAEGNSCAPTESSFPCALYVKNYDGDTMTFDIPGVHPLLGDDIAVRLDGADTPEIKTGSSCETKLATVARDYVKALLTRARRVDLIDVKRDKYFRIVAKVVADGADLSDLLLAKGYAVPYDGGTKKKVDWCRMKGSTGRGN
ncbi:MAG: thermonuclease family protein [Deltaproteobacteria bacterium]|nr:thermonuclease family protein [Deltaproteobacteria bacterium]